MGQTGKAEGAAWENCPSGVPKGTVRQSGTLETLKSLEMALSCFLLTEHSASQLLVKDSSNKHYTALNSTHTVPHSKQTVLHSMKQLFTVNRPHTNRLPN